MAYRIVKKAAVWWPVRWDDVEEDGTVVVREISLKYIRHPWTQEALDALQEDTTIDFMMKTVMAWRGVEDEHGEIMPFTRDAALEWLDQPGKGGLAMILAWKSCVAAEPATRLGNSAPSLATGPAAATPAVEATATATA